MRRFLGLSAVLVLASCSSSPAPEPVPPPVAVRPIAPPPSTPVPPREMKPMVTDACGAQELQYLVGKPRTDIPVPLDPSKRRVLCSTCAATMDYRDDRQTIVFDAQTGIIQSVKCG